MEIVDASSSKMDEISKMIQGDLTDLSRLSQLADTETIKKVCYQNQWPVSSNIQCRIFILICGLTFCTWISQNNQMENRRIIMEHPLWLISDIDISSGYSLIVLQNVKPKIIYLDAPVLVMLWDDTTQYYQFLTGFALISLITFMCLRKAKILRAVQFERLWAGTSWKIPYGGSLKNFAIPEAKKV